MSSPYYAYFHSPQCPSIVITCVEDDVRNNDSVHHAASVALVLVSGNRKYNFATLGEKQLNCAVRMHFLFIPALCISHHFQTRAASARVTWLSLCVV